MRTLRVTVTDLRKLANGSGAALRTWLMRVVVWRLLNEDAWKESGKIWRRAWKDSRGVFSGQRLLREIRQIVDGLGYQVKLEAPFWAGDGTRPSIWASELSLFSDLSPLFDRLATNGIEVRHSHDSEESGLRIWNAMRGSKTVLRITASLAYGAECKAIDTGETKPVLKFTCPGDADYPTEEVA